jgi:hypothetical protein
MTTTEDNIIANKLLDNYSKVFDQLMRHKNRKLTIEEFLENLEIE